MKRLAALFLSVLMLLTVATGCGQTTNNTGDQQANGTSSEPLRVGTMAVALGLPVQYALEQGYFEEAGLEIEPVIFASGAPINEAMAAGELDLAVSGTASVYALATGLYTYIGDGSITLDGEALYARPDSELVKTPGVVEGTLGSADTVKGISVLGPLATTAQFLAMKYVESFGLTSEDFNMVSMEYAQAYQSFLLGEGDVAAVNPPYTSQLEDQGYIKICGVKEALGAPMVNAIYAQKDVYEQRREDLKTFLSCYYRACAELNEDPELRKEFGIAWYAEEGITFSEADMDAEIAGKSYSTLETLASDEYPFGLTMISMAEFYADQGMIDAANLPNVEASMDSSLAEELKAEQ